MIPSWKDVNIATNTNMRGIEMSIGTHSLHDFRASKDVNIALSRWNTEMTIITRPLHDSVIATSRWNIEITIPLQFYFINQKVSTS